MTDPKIPLQQTKLWQKLQQDLNQTTFFLSSYPEDTTSSKENPETTNHKEVNYQMLIIKKSTILGPYFYLPCGPYLRQKSAANPAYEALQALIKREHVLFTRIEPQSPEIAEYWLTKAKKSKDLNPQETWVLDLTPEMDELYKNMKQNTRNLAKNYAKKGLEVKKVEKTVKNRQILENFLETTAKNRHFHPIEKETLKAELNQPFSSLFIAYYTPPKNPPENPLRPLPSQKTSKISAKTPEKIPVAAAMFFDDKDTRFYIQSGSDPAYKKLPATIAILDAAIRDAKAKNLKHFDFWGIAPENAGKDHPWAGFTQFKKSFGGAEKTYAGTYDLVHRPLKYRLYQILRKLNRLRRCV